MTTDPSPTDDVPRDKEDLLRDIERQRAQLGETVAALSSKLDVKSRATAGTKTALGNAKKTVQEKPGVVVAAVAGIIAFVAFTRKVRGR
jgi:ElaB/YqjD/DUF883 family membrane-anchored ribosome-binding protein